MRFDREGDVLARSNHVFEGYWNQPAATAKTIGDGGYGEGSYIAISDPKKDAIITGGENISSIGRGLSLLGTRGGGSVRDRGARREVEGDDQGAGGAATGRHLDGGDLVVQCRSKMVHYKCSTSVEIRDVLTHTAAGTLQKFKLRERTRRDGLAE